MSAESCIWIWESLNNNEYLWRINKTSQHEVEVEEDHGGIINNVNNAKVKSTPSCTDARFASIMASQRPFDSMNKSYGSFACLHFHPLNYRYSILWLPRENHSGTRRVIQFPSFRSRSTEPGQSLQLLLRNAQTCFGSHACRSRPFVRKIRK